MGSLSDGRKGQNGAKYVPPAAEVMIFALEKGFAISGDTDNNKTQGTGNTPGDNWKEIETFNWNN